MYQNLAVAYDGSEGSKLAFEKAAELFKLLPDAKITIIYVNEQTNENIGFLNSAGSTVPIASPIADNTRNQLIPPDAGEFADTVPAPEDTDIHDLSKRMHLTIQQRLDEKGIQASVLALDGPAVKTITAFIEEQQIDLLIVGNSGKSGLQRFFIGSVSKRLLQEADCSVLVVK